MTSSLEVTVFLSLSHTIPSQSESHQPQETFAQKPRKIEDAAMHVRECAVKVQRGFQSLLSPSLLTLNV